MSHKIGNSSDAIITINNGTYLAPAVGTYVTKYGCITGYSYGTVTATNAVITSNIGTTIFGMTIASISSGAGSIPGDSGGPYLAANAFCGVHHGHLSSDNSTVIFTPYSLILQGGFSAIGEHICARWTDIGPANHSGYCTICNETIYEVHSKYWDNFYGECTRCGRRDLIMVG